MKLLEIRIRCVVDGIAMEWSLPGRVGWFRMNPEPVNYFRILVEVCGIRRAYNSQPFISPLQCRLDR